MGIPVVSRLHEPRGRAIGGLAAAILAAFAIRVLPSLAPVFGAHFVSFQEPDAWFHVRTVHNLLAHFPRRSGFDPYMLYPGGRNIPTGPLWDYLLATPAWVLGFGSPSPELIDWVCAWVPAIMGALFPIPAWFLTRRYFGEAAAGFAALWIAIANGVFLWLTHLGLADHHAAESLFSFAALALLCEALDGGRPRLAWIAGISIGLFLATRPAGVFVPGILLALVLVSRAAAPTVLRTMAATAVVFFFCSGGLWVGITWMVIGATGAFAAAVWLLDRFAAQRGTPSALRRALPFALVALGGLVLLVLRPHELSALAEQVGRMAGITQDSSVSAVMELRPIYRAGLTPGWPGVFAALGFVWIPAIFGLGLFALRRPLSPGSRLLAVWTIVMTAGGIMQVRMVVYLLPVAALFAGVACAGLAGLARRWRTPAYALMAILILAVSLPFGIGQGSVDRGPTPDWLSALGWLHANTPEPLDPHAWSAYYPAISEDSGPPLGWGVAVWWDFGYFVEQIAHRIPMSNGTQSGAEEMAKFYLETSPEAAVMRLRLDGARYAIVDQRMPYFPEQVDTYFPMMAQFLGRDASEFTQVLMDRNEGVGKPVLVFLRSYYETMAMRLFVYDGQAVTGDGPWAFEVGRDRTMDGRDVDVIRSSRHCANQAEVLRFLAEHPDSRVSVGCLDPHRSCIDLAPVKGMRRVFATDPLPAARDHAVRGVKIFEVTR